MDLQCGQNENSSEKSLVGNTPVLNQGRVSHIGTDFTFKYKILWKKVIAYSVFHILGLCGLVLVFTLQAHLLTVIYSIFLYIIIFLGITMGAHRLFSHRAYKVNTTLWRVLLILFTMSGQDSLWEWVKDHRQHHRYSDTDADPHNASRGFFFSHVGWLLSRKHPKVLQYGKNIDMSDLEADPWVMFQKKYYFRIYFLVSFLIPCIIPVLLWNEDPAKSVLICYFARTTVAFNFTCFTNSLAHIYGSRPYDRNIFPTQSTFVSVVTLGEGWHNYHHTFPWDYRTSEYGTRYNLTTAVIDFCAKKGWIYDLRAPNEKLIENRIKRTGDNSHKKYRRKGTFPASWGSATSFEGALVRFFLFSLCVLIFFSCIKEEEEGSKQKHVSGEKTQSDTMGSDNSPKRPNAPPTDPEDDLFDGDEMGEPPGEIPGEFITMEEILDEDELLERIGGGSDSEEEAPVPQDTEEGGDYEPTRDDAVFTFREHSGPVFCGSFHPTESLVVTGSEDDTAYVWRIPSGEVIFKAEGHTDTIIAASFSYDGNFLATGDLGGFLQVFRVSENYRRVWNFGIGDMAWMEWHRASNVLMAGSESGEVYFWRIPSGDCKVIQGHSAKAECASLTADAKKIVVGYGDGAVKLWDIKTAAIVQEIPANSALGHTDGVLCVAADPEGSLFVSGGSDGRLVISSAAGPLGRVEAGDSVEAVAFSPIAEALKLVATGTLDGKITVWDVARQSPRCQCRDDELTGVTKLFWTRDMTLYAATLDGSVRVFEGRSGGLKASLLGHKKEVYDVQLDKSGEFLLTTSEDGTAKIFRAVS